MVMDDLLLSSIEIIGGVGDNNVSEQNKNIPKKINKNRMFQNKINKISFHLVLEYFILF